MNACRYSCPSAVKQLAFRQKQADTMLHRLSRSSRRTVATNSASCLHYSVSSLISTLPNISASNYTGASMSTKLRSTGTRNFVTSRSLFAAVSQDERVIFTAMKKYYTFWTSVYIPFFIDWKLIIYHRPKCQMNWMGDTFNFCEKWEGDNSPIIILSRLNELIIIFQSKLSLSSDINLRHCTNINDNAFIQSIWFPLKTKAFFMNALIFFRCLGDYLCPNAFSKSNNDPRYHICLA